jgi:MFS family permease
MYALSPLVGWLTDQLGEVRTVLTGAVVLLAAAACAGTAGPDGRVQLGAGLFLLGLGWSLGLISGSTLLSESVPGDVRTGVQGSADLVMGLAGAGGGALAGVIVGTAGYGVLNLLVGALVLVVASAAIGARVRTAVSGGTG